MLRDSGREYANIHASREMWKNLKTYGPLIVFGTFILVSAHVPEMAMNTLGEFWKFLMIPSK